MAGSSESDVYIAFFFCFIYVLYSFVWRYNKDGYHCSYPSYREFSFKCRHVAINILPFG